jgi:hypothetical protein
LLSHTSNYSLACRITTFRPSASSRLMLYSPRIVTFFRILKIKRWRKNK